MPWDCRLLAESGVGKAEGNARHCPDPCVLPLNPCYAKTPTLEPVRSLFLFRMGDLFEA